MKRSEKSRQSLLDAAMKLLLVEDNVKVKVCLR